MAGFDLSSNEAAHTIYRAMSNLCTERSLQLANAVTISDSNKQGTPSPALPAVAPAAAESPNKAEEAAAFGEGGGVSEHPAPTEQAAAAAAQEYLYTGADGEDGISAAVPFEHWCPHDLWRLDDDVGLVRHYLACIMGGRECERKGGGVREGGSL